MGVGLVVHRGVEVGDEIYEEGVRGGGGEELVVVGGEDSSGGGGAGEVEGAEVGWGRRGVDLGGGGGGGFVAGGDRHGGRVVCLPVYPLFVRRV